MGEDATLGDFVEGNGGSPAEPPDSGRTDTADIEPARTTYAYAPEGAVCGACGTTTDRRWRQDGALVCAGCKEW